MIARWAALTGYNPIETALYYTQFLNGFSEEERAFGQTLGKELLQICDWIWVFPSEDCPMISKEMRGEIEHAEKHGIKKYFWTQHKAGEIERWLHYYDLIMNFDKKVTK